MLNYYFSTFCLLSILIYQKNHETFSDLLAEVLQGKYKVYLTEHKNLGKINKICYNRKRKNKTIGDKHMKLTEMQTREFINILASDAPAPGGGSAAALAGAQGCGLGAMVCALTIGKAKYAEYEAANKTAEAKLQMLKDKFLQAMDEDTETFGVMTKVFAMPKNTEEEKAARRAAMQDALKVCTRIPMEMLGYSLEALQTLETIVGKSNQSASSDIGVAALNLGAAVRGAWLNVLINIGGIKDEEFVKARKTTGTKQVEEAVALSQKIYNTILAGL